MHACMDLYESFQENSVYKGKIPKRGIVLEDVMNYGRN
jgi:hypothetical protein